MKVTLPFTDDMAQATIEGRKTCTTRPKRYGSIGDVFRVENGFRFETLIFNDMKHITLQQVAADYYREEGFDSPQGFIDKWCQLHPRSKWVPNQLVWTHFYEKE